MVKKYTNKEIAEQFKVDATPEEIKKHIKETLEKMPKGSINTYTKMLKHELSDFDSAKELLGKHEVDSIEIFQHINRFNKNQTMLLTHHIHGSDGSIGVDIDFVQDLFEDIIYTLYSFMGVDADDIYYTKEQKETKNKEENGD